MRAKTSNHITVTENSGINVSEKNSTKPLFIGEYFNIHTFQKHPITSKFILQEAMRLKEWSELDTSLKIADFYDMRGYDPKQFYRWVAEYDEMSLANEYALRRLGSRREIGAMTRKFAETTIHRVHGHYDQIWREEMDKANQARLAVAEKSESKLVIMERYQLPGGEYRDVEVISTSQFTPEEVAANVRRNTATDRQVKVNANVGDSCE